MKKFLLLFLTIGLFSSCGINDDDGTDILTDYAPISEVALPETFELGETYDFKITYTLPSPCHELFGYEYLPDQNTHLFAIVTTFSPDDPACSDLPGETEEFTWKFTVNQRDLHTFKFWTGIDEDGQSIFITKEIEVLETNT